MPISDCSTVPARWLWAAAVVMASSLLVLGSAPAQDGYPIDAQFHSFVPAPPRTAGTGPSDFSLWQDDMEQARKAYRAKDYPAARGHLEAALGNGNIFAAWYLGHIWRIGLGVEPDQTKAVAYYRQVAMGYDPLEPRPGALDMTVDSLVRLADYYRDGDETANIGTDTTRAHRLYSAAAGHGHPGAQFGLAMMYLKGIGVRQNTDQALKWLMFAARKRFAAAEALLGDLYWEGTVVDRDRAQAIKWYLLASQTAHRDVNPHIFHRLEAMLEEASDSEKQSGQMSAELWADRFPETIGLRSAD